MLQTGSILQNRYRIDAVLGQGGMGVVYRAFDQNLQRECVVKELLIQTGVTQNSFQGAVAQFQQEAMTLSRLSHPNLPRVTDYFREGNNYYLVMDFVSGANLEHLMSAPGMAEMDVLRYATQLLSVLEYVHSQNVVHRDIKPSNIVIQPNGHLMLVDFGLAKQANLQTVQYMHGYGTEFYSPPEQYSGGTDPRSDLFSVGATMYHLLASRPPVSAADRMAGTALPNLSSMRPGLSPNTANAVMRAIEMDKRNRWQSAGEFKTALQLLTQPMKGTPPPTVHGYPPSSSPPLPPPAQSFSPPAQPKRNETPLGMIIAISALALLACGGVMVFVLLRDSVSPAATPGMTTGPAVGTAAQQTVIVTATDDPFATATADPDPEPTFTPFVITSEPIVITATPEPGATATASNPPTPPSTNSGAAGVISERMRLGKSAGGRDISMTQVGHMGGNGPAIVVVGRIAGEQYDTSDTVTELARHYEADPNSAPNDSILYLIENINPDGNGSNRFNANGVDLNRNWASFNWTRNPPVAGAATSGAGGAAPFSEPETRALRDLLLSLKASGREVVVMVLHSSARSGRREVFPGYTQAGTHAESGQLAQSVAGILGFTYSPSGSDPTTGELIAWCAENGIASVDIFWSRVSSNRPSLSRMVEVINVLSQ